MIAIFFKIIVRWKVSLFCIVWLDFIRYVLLRVVLCKRNKDVLAIKKVKKKVELFPVNTWETLYETSKKVFSFFLSEKHRFRKKIEFFLETDCLFSIKFLIFFSTIQFITPKNKNSKYKCSIHERQKNGSIKTERI